MLRRQLDLKKEKLAEMNEKSATFAEREAELVAAVAEVTTDEERDSVQAEIDKFEADKKALDSEKKTLESEIEDIESEIKDDEQERAKVVTKNEEEKTKREETKPMNNRTKFFGMTLEERTQFFENEQVRTFLSEVRNCIKEKRALTNVGLTIPEVMLPMLEEVAVENSKLLSRVNLEAVGGSAREVIMGTVPEAVWTEMCANLNELSLSFNDAEVDGYKVGGYFAVCNAILEDNDVQLATKIINALGLSIGKALDKAIIYGTGTKMPLGVVTRLAQTSAPADYPATARTWVDLHTSNVITGTGATGLNLFKEIIAHKKAIKNDYFKNGLTWVMNENTHTDLQIESLAVNANAAIMAGVQNVMPVVGGDIIELPFIPDGEIVVGYFDAYLLAQRAGTTLGQSEHVKFLADQTVFKGTARYDGLPVIAEAFAVFSITEDAPTTSGIPFPQDEANPS